VDCALRDGASMPAHAHHEAELLWQIPVDHDDRNAGRKLLNYTKKATNTSGIDLQPAFFELCLTILCSAEKDTDLVGINARIQVVCPNKTKTGKPKCPDNLPFN
jgi:hypothetical protein